MISHLQNPESKVYSKVWSIWKGRGEKRKRNWHFLSECVTNRGVEGRTKLRIDECADCCSDLKPVYFFAPGIDSGWNMEHVSRRSSEMHVSRPHLEEEGDKRDTSAEKVPSWILHCFPCPCFQFQAGQHASLKQQYTTEQDFIQLIKILQRQKGKKKMDFSIE